ncbi:LysR family transcriptional regulator [Pelagicoccus mobilis]|uniref:LysR family transcriptional regulator n=1 Tax=Pelagicoccus mobilis TaxID=415221 RepID=A0A934VSR3_9BACT|nr:LysR family transcriptional regulator [Pelagicoccus mobilis]MBK1878933.1 LysR family transcriptional regulator [Pelagicoccus mobilis]
MLRLHLDKKTRIGKLSSKNMELYQIKTFLAVVEECSVTKAAKRLYTTPPSVSSHIKALEEELGISLFNRSAKGMQLTSEGIAIRDKAERILAAVLDVTSEAASLRGQVLGGLEIGLNSSPNFLKATEFASSLRKEHPGLELNFLSLDSSKIIDAIRTENLDAGFVYTTGKLPDIELLPLQKTPLAIAVPTVWRNEIPDNDWDALAQHSWIYTSCNCAFLHSIETAFQKRNLTFRFNVKADGDEMRAELVAQGLGSAFMEYDRAKLLEEDGTAFIWKCEEEFCNQLYFANLARKSNDPAIKAARDTIAKVWKNNPSECKVS